METHIPFEHFSAIVLDLYHQDKEEFWAAVMSPFLADNTLLDQWRHRKIGLELISLFKDTDRDAKKLLKEFSNPAGYDVTTWKSLLAKDEYFRDAYPIYAFLVIWLEEHGLTDILAQFPYILESVVFGIAGYGILDVVVDGKDFSPVELLTAQALISEYETSILKTFGVTPVNLSILHQIRDKFLKAEIKEKILRGKASPYQKDKPMECGYKAAHLVTPFMLSLERMGRTDLIEPYFDVFFQFGAVIQILDDLKDLEDDISIGHFSYVTLETDAISLSMKGTRPGDITSSIRKNKAWLCEIFTISQKLLEESNMILIKLNDSTLARIVNVTELRLNNYFRKELKLDVR